MKEDTSASPTKHTPPLGHAALTPLYDVAIATLTREKTWRHELIATIAPKPGDRILDIGSGTGSLAAALHHECAAAHYIGVDPDHEAIQRAQRKTAKLRADIQFVHGYFTPQRSYFEQPPNKIVTSLVLHQVPLSEKRRIIMDAKNLLAPDGSIVIADYSLQTGLMRILFRWTVQSLDGVENTQPNADGILTRLLEDAGFHCVQESRGILTPTGSISILSANNH